MAHWAERLETEAKRAWSRVRPVLGDAVQRGNSRRVVVRDKGGKTLFQTSLTYAVLGAVVVLLIGQPLLPILIAGLVVAYLIGYRVAVVAAGAP